jgi:hypothetical protein
MPRAEFYQTYKAFAQASLLQDERISSLSLVKTHKGHACYTIVQAKFDQDCCNLALKTYESSFHGTNIHCRTIIAD